MTDLFVEIFPIMPELPLAFFAYRLEFGTGIANQQINRLTAKVARRAAIMSDGIWAWSEGCVITGVEDASRVIETAIAKLKAGIPEFYQPITGILPDVDNIPPRLFADFVRQTCLRDLDDLMRNSLHEDRIRNASVEREHRLQAWAVNGEPALSVSIASRLIYDQSIGDYIGG